MIDAYGAIKRIAASGRFVLADLRGKINTLWVEQDLTDAQRDELIELAETCIDPDYSPMTEGERALDERLFVVEAAMLEVGEIIARGDA